MSSYQKRKWLPMADYQKISNPQNLPRQAKIVINFWSDMPLTLASNNPPLPTPTPTQGVLYAHLSTILHVPGTRLL